MEGGTGMRLQGKTRTPTLRMWGKNNTKQYIITTNNINSEQQINHNFAGPTAHWRARSSVLVFGISIESPPKPPRRASGAQMCECQNYSWSPGRSIFRSFFRFDFGLNFGLVFDPFWTRLGLLLTPIWAPQSGQVGPKMHLESSFVRKC